MRKKVTSHDVAERAGVSRVTVSMILNRASGSSFSEATRKRVFEAAEDLGYRPNAAGRMLVSGTTESIGLVVCHAELLRFDGFIPQVLQAIAKVNQAHGYRVLLDVVEGNARPDAYASMVRSRQIDGLIVIDPASDDPQLRGLIDDNFPLVLLGSVHHAREHSVNFSTRRAIGLEIDHLVRLGHRVIAHVTYSPAGYVATDTRLSAYRAALDRHQLPQDERLVAYAAFSAASGFSATQELLARGGPLPSAILAGNDTIALGAIAAVAGAGFDVPRDIAVIGFDDLPIAAFMQPPLTTVHNPAAQQGELAAEMLVKLLRHETVENPHIRVPVNLVIRASCGGALKPADRRWDR